MHTHYLEAENKIDQDLIVRAEVKSDFEDKRLPTRDFSFSHMLRKKIKNQQVMEKKSMMGENQNTLDNQLRVQGD